jgi:hypothetical protein
VLRAIQVVVFASFAVATTARADVAAPHPTMPPRSVVSTAPDDAPPPNPRRRLGTKITWAGVAAFLTGGAVGAFAIGLSMDRPEAAKPFFAAAGVSLGLGVIGIVTGVYVRATSPGDAPDAISQDRVRARHRNERRVGIAMMGASAAVLATGIAHFVGAWRDDDLSHAQCPQGVCNDDGARLQSRSHTLLLAAYMLSGPGVIGLAGGLALYRGGRDTGARIVPVAGAHDAGAAIVGHF